MGNLCCSKKEPLIIPNRKTLSKQPNLQMSLPTRLHSHSLPLHLSIPYPADKNPQGLPGLINLGNTCFMNSALQCIVNTQPLLDYFLIGLFESEMNLNKSNPYKSSGHFSKAFACLALASWRQDETCLAPKSLLQLVIKYAPNFNNTCQQDAHEFLSFFLDILHEELNRADKNIPTPSFGFKKSCESRAARSWNKSLRNNTSIIVDLFQGQLRSITKCQVCKGESVKFESFMNISLPVPKSGRVTLYDCFREFCKPEVIDKDNSWVCPKCKVKVKAIRKCDIWKLPPVLIIHFKRFNFDGKKIVKTHDFVDFPVDSLDLKGFAIGKQKEICDYTLYGQICHKGTLDNGHFFSVIKNWRDGQWYVCDDSVVRYKNPYKLVKDHAYVLFYQRKSQSCFRQQCDFPEMWPHEVTVSRSQNHISDEESYSFISNCSHFSGNST